MSPNCDAVVWGLNATEGDDAVLMSATRPDGVGAAPAEMSLTEDHVGTSGERAGVCTDTFSDGDSAADAIDDVPGGPTDDSVTGRTACTWKAHFTHRGPLKTLTLHTERPLKTLTPRLTPLLVPQTLGQPAWVAPLHTKLPATTLC